MMKKIFVIHTLLTSCDVTRKMFFILSDIIRILEMHSSIYETFLYMTLANKFQQDRRAEKLLHNLCATQERNAMLFLCVRYR